MSNTEPAPRLEAPASRLTPDIRRRSKVPIEGADGLFSQTWFPLCRSTELAQGYVTGREFLGGKVAIYRGSDGKARVVSAYCAHMGADLSIGTVVGNHIRCPFHHFEYGVGGLCVKTGIDASPPKGAKIFEFPTDERWGLIWAFNGEQPLWHLPALDHPEQDMVLVERDVDITTCEPYMVTANAFDWQHFATLHDLHSSKSLTGDDIRWDPYSCGFDFEGMHWQGEKVAYKIEIFGTNIYLQQGTFNGRWYVLAFPMGLPRPGLSKTFMQLMVPKGDGSAHGLRQAQYAADALADMEYRFIVQDREILNSIHFGPGYLLPEDSQFTTFMRFLKNYPRANPARSYLE